jgi:hypothetical protein
VNALGVLAELISLALQLQVVNGTMLRINVGESTGVARDVKVLCTLEPHERFCISAVRSEPGLILFQPAG